MSEFLFIYINKLDDGGLFFQHVLIHKVLEITGAYHRNGLPIPTKVEAPLGKEYKGCEAKRYLLNSYASAVGMMLYLASNTRLDISFSVHYCKLIIHDTKASRKTALRRICWYFQGTKKKSLMFNPYKKLVVNCYYGAYFVKL